MPAFDKAMRLPKADEAVAEPAKTRDYLLSTDHPVGSLKSAFFRALGCKRDDWRRLHDDLIRVGRSGSALPGRYSVYGKKYEVRGILQGPVGRRAEVVTVWIILENETFPRFVTAFPSEAR